MGCSRCRQAAVKRMLPAASHLLATLLDFNQNLENYSLGAVCWTNLTYDDYSAKRH